MIRWGGRIIAWTIAAVVLAAAAPVTTVAVIGVAGAWLRGWPPSRLRRAAAWSLPMTGIYLAGHALGARTWQTVLAAPYRDWLTAWHMFDAGGLVPAFVRCAPVAVPAGLYLASAAWAQRIYRIETGLSGKTATAPVIFDERQWRRQVRAALGRIAAPGAVPLTDRRGRIVMGATIRAVGHRWRPVLALPYQVMGRHQVIIGSSGSGKTNLMIRTWAGWFAAALRASVTRAAPRPLLVVMDCKGGPDARAKAAHMRRLLHAAGARRAAIWPDEAAVSLWTLPPRDLAVTLFQLLQLPAEGPAAFYADVTQAAVMLAVTAPPGPPASGAAFLDRLDHAWLSAAYAGDPSRLSAVDAARRHLPDIALRYRTLLERLGPAFDGTARLGDADAWYFILEGTREQSVAEAQAMAITELLAHAATSMHAEPRTMLLACDDYSAVSGRVPLWQLYERGRSLGIGVQVSAQSWHGLGATEDERYRIAATADGGIWLMRTPHPEPVSQLAGTRRVIETATKVIGSMWGDEGSSRVQHAWTADPGIARRLATGQAAYIHAGGCTWVQIARPRPSPLALTGPAESPGRSSSPRQPQARARTVPVPARTGGGPRPWARSSMMRSAPQPPARRSSHEPVRRARPGRPPRPVRRPGPRRLESHRRRHPPGPGRRRQPRCVRCRQRRLRGAADPVGTFGGLRRPPGTRRSGGPAAWPRSPAAGRAGGPLAGPGARPDQARPATHTRIARPRRGPARGHHPALRGRPRAHRRHPHRNSHLARPDRAG